MSDAIELGATVTKSFDALLGAMIGFLPQLLVAAVILIVGWLAARLMRAVAVRLARGLERFAGSIGFDRAIGGIRPRDSTVAIIGSVVYWLVMFVFITAATHQLGLQMFTGWLDQIVAYLPTLISGVIIVFAGIVIANLVRETVVALATAIPGPQRESLGRAAQFLTLMTMVIVGVDQIGIDVTLINTLVAVGIGAFLGGLSISFSLGARTFASNLLGMRYLADDVQVGQRIRVGGIDGTVIEVGQTSVVLDTPDGRTRIPGKFFGEEPTIVVGGSRTDG